ncbi:malignant fibrous histiocytoma-amplified sequence 1 homolog [Branchiostoma lanceolatum]|uniref:malignant fibrous histiocytoma-amplified sequence 1 homolog n=1 Tax=Branchiostoma lanceolatum TaxID=7740 RepID=UPI00345189BD
MEFFNLLENTLVVIELYGVNVGWALMTCLLATVVSIFLYCLVNRFQTRQREEEDSLPQPAGQVDEARVEDRSLVEDVSSQQDGHDSLIRPFCKEENCVDDHESTFLFDQEKHVDVEHITLTQRHGNEDQCLTIFEEINQFTRLKTVTIIGYKLDDSSFINLFRCVTIRSLKLSYCQLASIPQSLVNLKDLAVLDLSHNNLTTLQAVPFHSLPCLKSLNISHNSIQVLANVTTLASVKNFDVSYNNIEEIPYEILEMENLEVFSCNHNKIVRWLQPSTGPKRETESSLVFLNLSNNLLHELPWCVKELRNISELNLSHNKIGENVSETMETVQLAELFYLPLVSSLMLGNNNIKSLPSLDMSRVSPNMEYIDLSNNAISVVPAALLLLTRLKVLLLSSNEIEKLPADLDLNDLSPTLCVIDLSDNKLDDLPLALCFLRSLKKLDLKQNKISVISENVKSCKSLAFLDVSHNKLKEIPSHVIGLPKLVEIRASNNQINSVSSLQRDELSMMEVVALAENGLSHFPVALIQMEKLKKVDLRSNEIKVIPQSVMGMSKDVKLNVQDNPLVDPPLQVCQAGLPAIKAFYEDLTTASSITQCLKTLFLGTYEAGKTSLVRVFQMNRSSLTKPEERTHGIEIAELHLSAPNTPDITLSVWDFAGQETYYITHQFFLSAKALMLLIVNLETYKYDSDSFELACGKWLENMIARVGNPVVIPVATHIDKLSPADVQQRCEDLAKKLEDQERTRITDLQRQLKRINDSLIHVESMKSKKAVSDRKKQIETLLSKRPSIHSKPVPVSSAADLEGIQYLKQVILNYAVNKELFPEVGRSIPKAWADTEACVERKAEELSFPYMTWDAFTALMKQSVPNLRPESRIKTVAQYLHDTGKILWYSEIDSLNKHVFLKPASLVDIFRKVFRHDLETFLDYESDPRYRAAEITPAEFQKMKNDLVNRGVLHTKLLRCLWSDVEKKCRSGTFEHISDVLIKLMQQFDLCYDLCVRHDDSDKKQQAFDGPLSKRRRLMRRLEKDDLEDKQECNIPRALLSPWHIKEDKEDKIECQWKSGGTPIVSIQYQSPSFIPPGLFARFTVRAHRPEHNLHFVSHWNTGALCKHKRNRVLVLLKNEGTKGIVVSLSARPESGGVHGDTFENLWDILTELSSEVEDLLKQWPGVLFDRLAVCPECHRPSFPGNWLPSSSRRPDEEEICSLCNKRVSVKYLIPRQRTMAYLAVGGGLGAIAAFAAAARAAWDVAPPSHYGYPHYAPEQHSADRYVSKSLSDRQLLRVAKKLGVEWESLAVHMGFTKADMYKFKSDHPHNTEQQIFMMLTAWRDRLGSSATREELQRVLEEAEVDDDATLCLY